MILHKVFLVVTNFIALFAYFRYFIQVKNDSSTPNPTTWSIWFFTGLLNAITYHSIVKHKLDSIFIWVILFWSLIILIYSLVKGKFTKFNVIDAISLILVIILYVFYFYLKNDVITHVLIQFVYIISYVPTINSLIKNKSREDVVAWYLAFLTYFFAFIGLVVANEKEAIKYLHIILNGFVGNGVMIYLIKKRTDQTL